MTVMDILSAPWLGTVIGVISFIAAIYFYIKSRRHPRLAYQVEEVSIVGSGKSKYPKSLKILYDDVPVDRLTTTRVVLWNAGNVTIRGDDIVKSDPLRLEVPAASRLLEGDRNAVTRAVTQSKFNFVGPSTAHIQFDFLDPGDGLTMEMNHSASRGDLKVLGTVRGIPKGLSNYGQMTDIAGHLQKQMPVRLLARPKEMFSVMIVVGIGLIIWGLYRDQIQTTFPALKSTELPTNMPSAVWVVLGLIYLTPPLVLLWVRRRRFPPTLALRTSEEGEAEPGDEPVGGSSKQSRRRILSQSPREDVDAPAPGVSGQPSV